MKMVTLVAQQSMGNVAPLDFNGEEDTVFQSYDEAGGKFIKYLYDYGTYDDVPYEPAPYRFNFKTPTNPIDHANYSK